MKQYIDKSALVAEIENEINKIDLNSIGDWRYRLQREHDIEVMKNIISFINTLEVKEADLEKEIEEVKHNYKVDDNRHTSICSADIEWIAKHFFEFGLKVQKGD